MPLIYIQDEFGCPAPVEVSVLGLGTDDQTAAEVAYTPGNVAGATTVQEALDQLALCQVCEIQAANDCAGGVGADYAVRQAALANGVLTLDGAPEHTSIAGNDPSDVPPSVVVGGTLSPPGPTVVVQFSVVDVIANPSACRAMNVLFSANAYAYVVGLSSNANLVYTLQSISDRGPGAITHANNQVGGEPNSTYNMTVTVSFVIPAGGVATVTTLAQIEIFAGSYVSSIQAANRAWIGSKI
jgi:hypothetical protein